MLNEDPIAFPVREQQLKAIMAEIAEQNPDVLSLEGLAPWIAASEKVLCTFPSVQLTDPTISNDQAAALTPQIRASFIAYRDEVWKKAIIPMLIEIARLQRQ